MTWFVKALGWGQFRLGRNHPRDACIDVREAGRRGAAAANAKRKAPILEKARQLRKESGLPPHPALGGC